MAKVVMLVRVDEGLKAAIEEAAVRENRSMTSLINIVMEEWLARHGHSLPTPERSARRQLPTMGRG
jgi:hypothetical protein